MIRDGRFTDGPSLAAYSLLLLGRLRAIMECDHGRPGPGHGSDRGDARGPVG